MISRAMTPELFGGWLVPGRRGSRSPIGSSQVAPWARRSAAVIGEPAAARPALGAPRARPRTGRRSRRSRGAPANGRAPAGGRARPGASAGRAAGGPRPSPRRGRAGRRGCRSVRAHLDRVDVAVPGREAARGELDRRREDRVARQPAMPRVGGAPGANRAGGRDRSGPMSGNVACRRRASPRRRPRRARPDPLSAVWRPVAASQMSQNASPPIPQPWGMTTPSTAFVAIAASTADPPARSTPSPAAVARWWGATTAPCRPRGERQRGRAAARRGLHRARVYVAPARRNARLMAAAAGSAPGTLADMRRSLWPSSSAPSRSDSAPG